MPQTYLHLVLSLALLAVQAAAAPDPSIKLDAAVFTGVTSGITSQFLGIPYAKPPVGDLRLRLPVAYPPYIGRLEATSYGPMCPNQFPQVLPENLPGKLVDKLAETLWVKLYEGQEDCLTVNVIAPGTAHNGSALPVVAWIYGGAFTMGATSEYHGENVVTRAIEIGEPIIYVSFNYRLGVLGFLGGQQVKDAGVGNLGLQDQRLALHWIQRYISNFGGDPTRVTLWGESAGAMSVGLQMLANQGNTEGLYRAAFMQSGSPIPVGDIKNGQKVYDDLTQKIGCSNTTDTLACLRRVPFQDLFFTANNLDGIYIPRVDGKFLVETPFEAIKNGRIARIPYVTGDLDDEGTIFAIPWIRVATDAQFKDYLKSRFFPSCSSTELDQVMKLYPNDPTIGSPYGTGTEYEYSPNFKRIASVEGDMVFQVPRRYLLEQTWDKQKTWNYLSLRGKTAYLGSYHTSDLEDSFGDDEAETDYIQEYMIRFVAHMDPNSGPPGPTLIKWPQYTLPKAETLYMDDKTPVLFVGNDTFRTPPMNYLRDLALKDPL